MSILSLALTLNLLIKLTICKSLFGFLPTFHHSPNADRSIVSNFISNLIILTIQIRQSELIKSCGLIQEVHYVMSQDDYILTTNRIIN